MQVRGVRESIQILRSPPRPDLDSTAARARLPIYIHPSPRTHPEYLYVDIEVSPGRRIATARRGGKGPGGGDGNPSEVYLGIGNFAAPNRRLSNEQTSAARDLMGPVFFHRHSRLCSLMRQQPPVACQRVGVSKSPPKVEIYLPGSQLTCHEGW